MLQDIQSWSSTWRIKANKSKSTHVTFTLRKTTWPPVTFNGNQLPQADDVKYLGMYLDHGLTRKNFEFSVKRKTFSVVPQPMCFNVHRL